MKKTYVRTLVALFLAVMMTMSLFTVASAENSAIESEVIYEVAEAMKYVEKQVRENDILQLHFYGKLQLEHGMNFEVYVPELKSVFSAQMDMSRGEYWVAEGDLDIIVDEILNTWWINPLSLYEAAEYVEHRMAGSGVEAVFASFSLEGEDAYFNFCCLLEGLKEDLRFIEVKRWNGEYLTTFAELEAFCERYEAQLMEQKD